MTISAVAAVIGYVVAFAVVIDRADIPRLGMVSFATAQMLRQPVGRAEVVQVSELVTTARGEGLFGSTGVGEPG